MLVIGWLMVSGSEMFSLFWFISLGTRGANSDAEILKEALILFVIFLIGLRLLFSS
jgi:hypothetical protein